MTQTGYGEALQESRMSRQALLVDSSVEAMKILIIGVGGIGSNAAHLFASMGVHDITLLDNDDVEEENIFPGWFYPANVGLSKVEAVANQLAGYGIVATAYNTTIEDFEPDPQILYDLVLVCTDNIHSRKNAYMRLRDNTSWWLDARMGGSGCNLKTISMADADGMSHYINRELLPANSSLLCGEKATAYNTKGTLMQFIGWTLRDLSMSVYPPYEMVAMGSAETIIRVKDCPKPQVA